MPHIHEKIDLTVEVFVVYNSTVLLRKHDKYKIWLSVGGHVEPGEDPNQAAMREVEEETALVVRLFGKTPPFPWPDGYVELIPPRFLNRHKINDTHEHVSMTYFATSAHNQVIEGKDEVSDEIHWFTYEELDDPRWGIRESVKYYAKKALEEVYE